MRPLVLLDFDGVLNAISGPSPPALSCWSDWTTCHEDGFRLWFSRSAAAAVAELGEVHWLTTWNEDNKANTLLCPRLGIGPFPVAAATAKIAETNWLTTWNENDSANILLSPLLSIGPFPVAAAPPVNYDPLWKPRAVAGQLSTGRPVVWFDDEAEDLWAHWGKEKPNNLFLLAPDESRGLTKLELEAAADWLKKRSSSLP